MVNRIIVKVNLEEISRNLLHLRSLLPKGTLILGVVKSNAYGHGAASVSRRLAKSGIDWLGVGSADEASELRDYGINIPILLLGAPLRKNIPCLVKRDISLSAVDEDMVAEVARAAAALGKTTTVHLPVDTGMGRLGQYGKKALDVARRVKSTTGVTQIGTFTHFFSNEKDVVQKQMLRFRKFLTELGYITSPGIVHAASSHTLHIQEDSHLSMVRSGLMLYGIGSCSRSFGMGPAMQVMSEIVFIKHIPQGRNVGYHPGYRTPKDTVIATVPVGYADGYPRVVENPLNVIIRDKLAPVVGRVSMDYLTVDVRHIPNVKVGDPVTLLGSSNGAKVLAGDLARASGRLEYEVTLGFGGKK